MNLVEIITNEMKLRNYSRNTISSYIGAVRGLYNFFKKSPRLLQTEDLKKYLLYLQDQGKSSQSISLVANAINFLYSQIYKRNGFLKFRHPKRSKKLPVVLNREEIKNIFSQTDNLKHKILLSLSYGSGLRVSEAINMRVQDLDLIEKTVTIRQGKGKKDRISVLPESLINDLTMLAAGKSGGDYVFFSERGGHITAEPAQKVADFPRYMEIIKINK